MSSFFILFPSKRSNPAILEVVKFFRRKLKRQISFMQLCSGFSWDRVNFIPSSWYSVVV